MPVPNLRELADSTMIISIEGPFGLPAELTDPDGVEYTNNNRGTTLKGQLLFDSVEVDPDTGEVMAVEKPIAVFRRASLTRVPKDGERWAVKMPLQPSETANKTTLVFDGSQALLTGGKSLGIIRIPLQFAEQSP